MVSTSTQRDTSLPDFLIIGAQKSGTTALIHNLARHPDVYAPTHEIHFFKKHWDLGIDWYRSHFTEPTKLQGEKTPEYMRSKTSHMRMAAVVPNAKLIISLRNPIDRAYSQWNHFNQIIERSSAWGWKKMPFIDAIRQPDRAMSSMISAGQYYDQISDLMKYFPRKQIHILISERLRKNTEIEYENLLRFLELPSSPHRFINEHEREYIEPLGSALRSMLHKFFEPHNNKLREFLDDAIPEWTI